MKVSEEKLEDAIGNIQEVILPRAENIRESVESLEYPSDDPIFPEGGKIDFSQYIDNIESGMNASKMAVELFLAAYRGANSDAQDKADELGSAIDDIDINNNGNLSAYGIDPEFAEILEKFGIDKNIFENCDLNNQPKIIKDESGKARRVDYNGLSIYSNGEYVDNISGLKGKLGKDKITYKFDRPEDMNDIDEEYVESLRKKGYSEDFAKMLYHMGIDENTLDGDTVKVIKDEHGEVRYIRFDEGLDLYNDGRFADVRTGNEGKINIGNTIDFEVTVDQMKDFKYMDAAMAEYLERNDTSVKEVNEQLRNTVLDAGPGTRDGAVAAMLGLVNAISAYDMKLPYISSTGAGGTASGKYGEYGVSPDWGTYSKDGWTSAHYNGHVYHQTGLDCSGVVAWAMHNGGYEYENKSSWELYDLGEKHEMKDGGFVGQPGDLVWRAEHIGMIVETDENGYVIAEEIGDDSKHEIAPKGEGLMLTRVKFNGNDTTTEKTFTHIIDMSEYYDNDDNKDLDYFK